MVEPDFWHPTTWHSPRSRALTAALVNGTILAALAQTDDDSLM